MFAQLVRWSWQPAPGRPRRPLKQRRCAGCKRMSISFRPTRWKDAVRLAAVSTLPPCTWKRSSRSRGSSAPCGPDRAMGKLMAATVRGAPLLVYLSKDLDTGSEAEAGFFREMKDAPVAFLREPGLGLPSALNPLLVLKPEALGADARQLKKGPL